MAKRPTLSDITTGHGTTTKLNANFDAIEQAFDKTLSRDGSSPNAMQADLDMNSNQIINLPDATTSSEPLTLRQYLAGATATVNGFRKETQIATAGQTVFTANTVQWVPGVDNLVVFLDGVMQGTGNYSINTSTQITFSAGVPLNTRVDFLVMNIAGTIASTTTDAGLVTYQPAGTTNVTNVETKLRESVSVKDFGAIGDGVTDDTAAIQAAHDYAASLTITGMAKVIFPAGTYIFTSLNWSPLVSIFCDGQVILKTSITSGKAIYVSTQFGNWNTAQKQIDYHGNTFVSGGKLMIQNTNGRSGNTATGMFFGADGPITDPYSAESISLHCIHFEGWKNTHRFGSHAYLITFINSFFGDNENVIYNDVGVYDDRLERITYIDCTFSQNVNVITGDATCNGDFTFQACSFDYNVQILPNITNAMVISVGGGSHIETGESVSNVPFFTMAGGSLSLSSYYVAYFAPSGGSGPDPIIASIGANGFVRSQGMTALTPTGATLFKLTSTSAKVNVDDDYRQFGGLATTYINNTVGGYVEKWFSPIFGGSPNQFLLGEYPEIKARLTGVYTHEFTKTGIAAGATVDLFSVGPVASFATGRMTVQATSTGLVTVKIADFAILGGGTTGGINITASEDYSGGASSFTIGEVLDSPSSGYNKVTFTNTSAATCSLICSIQVNYLSNNGLVTPL